MASSPNGRLQNLYVARLTTQERPCFVCSKFTSVVLTSADNSNADWFYICRAHLGNFNFCSKLGGKPVKSPTAEQKKDKLANRPVESDSVTELVSSIGSAWKSWRGSDKKDEKKDDKDDKDEKKEEKDEKKEEKKEEKDDSPSPPPSTPSSPQQPVRFIIQRDYFYLRQRECLKKTQKKEATEKLKTLQFPEVPKNMPTLK
ncbi:unnamed protein product [Mucor hiemalis]